jgi:hypothetical protein
MKKLLIPLLLVLFMSCKVQQAVLGMNEQQFTKEHKFAARQVELSAYRTVYREPYYESFRFYYFKDGKLYLMDQGFMPRGAKEPVPTP